MCYSRMCDSIRSVSIGVLTGLTFGGLGIITGASLSVVLLLGMSFAVVAELLINPPEEFENRYMQTDYW